MKTFLGTVVATNIKKSFYGNDRIAHVSYIGSDRKKHIKKFALGYNGNISRVKIEEKVKIIELASSSGRFYHIERIKKCPRCKGLGLIAQDMMHGGRCSRCMGKRVCK